MTYAEETKTRLEQSSFFREAASIWSDYKEVAKRIERDRTIALHSAIATIRAQFLEELAGLLSEEFLEVIDITFEGHSHFDCVKAVFSVGNRHYVISRKSGNDFYFITSRRLYDWRCHPLNLKRVLAAEIMWGLEDEKNEEPELDIDTIPFGDEPDDGYSDDDNY